MARDPWWQRLVKLCVSWVFTSYIPLLAFGCWIYICKICWKANWPCFSLVFPDKNLDGSFTMPAENCGVSLFLSPIFSVSNYLLHLIILATNYLTMPCLSTHNWKTRDQTKPLCLSWFRPPSSFKLILLISFSFSLLVINFCLTWNVRVPVTQVPDLSMYFESQQFVRLSFWVWKFLSRENFNSMLMLLLLLTNG